ncbi:hypothetical protein VLK31_30905 [Variovorax sp. H27-G14]|uniref:hypothetical protein n=1 Tax=Variovorax sp. H27-G14 TaxID=3111914 RepID=UPI0038FCBCDD
MKTTRLLMTAAALSFVALGASAESYQGVLQFQSSASRAAVQAGAVVAAHGTDPYAEGASAGVPTVVAGLGDRAQARANAIAAARAGNIYGDGAVPARPSVLPARRTAPPCAPRPWPPRTASTAWRSEPRAHQSPVHEPQRSKESP